MSFPNEVQAISYSSNLQTQTKGDKFYKAKNIFWDGSGMTEALALEKFCGEISTYISTGFEAETGLPASGFNFFPEFSSSRKGNATNDIHFYGIIYIWYNTVTKIYTT